MFAVLVALAAHATCPEDADRRVMVDARQVLQAFDAADPDLLASARDGLARGVPCVRQPPSDALLRSLHRAMALAAYADRDLDASTRAWAALRHLDPTLGPDPRRFGDSHGIWAAFVASEASDDGSRAPLPRRPGGWLVDGQRARTAPQARAFVLSARDRRGRIVHTGYYYRPGEMPALESDEPRIPVARAALVGGGGVLVIGGLGVLASAAKLERDILDGRIAAEEIETGKRVANRRYAAGGVLAGVGAGLGVAGFVVRW